MFVTANTIKIGKKIHNKLNNDAAYTSHHHQEVHVGLFIFGMRKFVQCKQK